MLSKNMQIVMIKYYWGEFGNLNRWNDWEKYQHNFLALHSLLEIKDYLNKTIDHVIQKLGGKNEMP